MWYFVALANPGKEYELTRHNVGAFVLKKIMNMPECDSEEIGNYMYDVVIDGKHCCFMFSNSYMNNSGDYVKKAQKTLKFKPEQLVIIHDDQDVALGEVKLQFNRGAAGHNGITSVANTLGTQDFGRLRIGIERVSGAAMADHVLGKFSDDELETLEKVTQTTFNYIKNLLKYGKDGALSRQGK